MSVPHPPSVASSRRFIAAASLAAALVAVACLTAADPTKAEKPKETLVGGQPLFANWPANQKPDAVIVFSGQTYGYLQPCGCSRPQTGGLERRAVFIDQLKKKGWPVAGVDLGDIYPEKVALAEQGKLKYTATMNALREMGYLGVGIGKTEMTADVLSLLATYALQKEQRPFTLAGNAVGVVNGKEEPRTVRFDMRIKDARPLVELIEVGKVGEVAVGVTGVVGGPLREDNIKHKWDTTINFPKTKEAITDALTAFGKHKLKPQVKVLIFQGSSGDAANVAKDFPQFQVILCQSEEGAPPPMMPQTVVGKKGETTLIVQVGQKGQHVGVLGAFKKQGGGFDFKYQLVPLGEEYITPGTETEALASNKALQILDVYAKAVKDAKFLKEYPRVAHSAQVLAQGLKPPVALTYVGSEACKACHAAEFKQWTNTHHSHAMDTLEKVAKRPSLRNFDGECVKCHTVGFDYQKGYVDDATTKHLRHVGCESCHGPGSGHVAAPKRQDLLALMSEWKQPGVPKLPGNDFMEKMAKLDPVERGKEAIAPAQQLLINRVSQTCMHCHDHEADPHFDLYKNWAKISHTGLAPAGGWPAEAPKK
jgi:2',3'-cyclic-nucleotide 2'-phosphodiesterase (5'-nucleotidase family)